MACIRCTFHGRRQTIHFLISWPVINCLYFSSSQLAGEREKEGAWICISFNRSTVGNAIKYGDKGSKHKEAIRKNIPIKSWRGPVLSLNVTVINFPLFHSRTLEGPLCFSFQSCRIQPLCSLAFSFLNGGGSVTWHEGKDYSNYHPLAFPPSVRIFKLGS